MQRLDCDVSVSLSLWNTHTMGWFHQMNTKIINSQRATRSAALIAWQFGAWLNWRLLELHWLSDVVEFYLSARPASEMLPTSSDFGFLEFLLSDICQEYTYLFHTEICEIEVFTLCNSRWFGDLWWMTNFPAIGGLLGPGNVCCRGEVCCPLQFKFVYAPP